MRLFAVFQGDIREHFRTLMGRKKHQPVTSSFLPHEQMAIDYQGGSAGPPCSIENFKLDLRNTSNSDWSMALVAVFCDDFIYRSDGRYSDTDRSMIKSHFLKHVDYLHGRYLHYEADPQVIAAKARSRARQERKARASSHIALYCHCNN